MDYIINVIQSVVINSTIIVFIIIIKLCLEYFLPLKTQSWQRNVIIEFMSLMVVNTEI